VSREPYRTIVADPPWRYQTTSGLTSKVKDKGTPPEAERRYGSMSIDEIAALPVREWADANAHLYLWVTNPLIFDAYPVVAAWGFRYVTMLTWRKVGPLGMGYYFRGETEHVLFCVRGKAPIPSSKRERNWLVAPKTVHSAKPDRFYEIVERVSPGPYLELFARRRRYGWDVWGNEAPEQAASQAVLGLDAA
jgi:N6-adenosine-specific RNA methylase IME4